MRQNLLHLFRPQDGLRLEEAIMNNRRMVPLLLAACLCVTAAARLDGSAALNWGLSPPQALKPRTTA